MSTSRIRLSYNAPVTLTFALACTVVLLATQATDQRLLLLFSVGGQMNPRAPISYLRLLLHPLGHLGWDHLVANLGLIMLLGPVLEEKYGQLRVVVWMVITAVVTGLINWILLPTALAGASGIAFMMILLVSFANRDGASIPLSFVAVAGLYLAREVIGAFQDDSISQLAHIVGGLTGAVLGLTAQPRTREEASQAEPEAASEAEGTDSHPPPTPKESPADRWSSEAERELAALKKRMASRADEPSPITDLIASAGLRRGKKSASSKPGS